MSIASEITRLQNAKASLKTSINAKTDAQHQINNETLEDYSNFVDSITAGGSPEYTGSYDSEGLSSQNIGWTSDDISYYQNNYVQWMSEFDDYYKLTTTDKSGVTSNKCRYYPKSASFGPINDAFYGYNKLIGIPYKDTSNRTTFEQCFMNCYNLLGIPLIDTSSCTSFRQMFASCYALFKIPLIDTSNGTNTGSMFNNCYSLRKVPALNMKKVQDSSYMFNNCRGLISVGKLDASLGNLTTMEGMFSTCMALQVLDLSLFDTSSVTNMASCFNFCVSLRKLDIRNMVFTNVTSYSSMFGTSASDGPANDCLIIVKDNTAKTWIRNKFSRLTNVKTVSEYEASLNS